MNNLDKCYIIAEAGVNHNGSLKLAKELIDIASEAQADAVKFQTFKADQVISKTAPKAEYQITNTGDNESQLEMVKKLELDRNAHYELINYCQQKNIQFLSTPFDIDSLKLLTKTFDLPLIKIPSGEITNAPFLLKIAQTQKPVILSTGMSTLGEIETALGVLAFGYLNIQEKPSISNFQSAYFSEEGQAKLQQNVTLLHCVTEYPTPFNQVNLKAMDTLKSAFNLPVGYSDHTLGISVSIAAVARGATVIEKHFTCDRTLPGPDHQASLEPSELKQMIKSIREVELALGDGLKKPASVELKNRTIARKSLVANQNIKQGEIFTEDNLTCKRPGDGISPLFYWEYIGKIANQHYHQDELI